MTPDILAERKKIFNVLVVDDEQVLADLAQRFLEQENFCTDAAYSADEALLKISQYPYDIIVSDYQMPGKDGIELLREVKKQYPALPFILFTGRSREEVVIQALNEGADFYIQKGADIKPQFAELAHHIRRAIERRSAASAIEERNEVLGAIISASPLGIALVKSRTIQWLNESLAAMLGYESRELLGMPVRNLYGSDEDFLNAGEQIAAELNRNGQSKIQVRLKKKNGSMMECEAQMACLNTKNPLYSRMVTFREITVRPAIPGDPGLQPEVMPGGSTPLIEIDAGGEITYLNPAAIDLFTRFGRKNGLETFLPLNTGELIGKFRVSGARDIYHLVSVGPATFIEHITFDNARSRVRISISGIEQQTPPGAGISG
jgi:PAS domain S-box-containing protein